MLCLGIMIFVVVIMSMSFVSGYRLLCMNYGESIPPAPADARYTCWHDKCQICVNDNLNPGVNPAHCSDMGVCESLGGSGEGGIDLEPPEIIINSPNNGDVFSSRKVIFDIELNEPSSLYYIDNINGRNRWKRMGNLVRGYERGLSFKDGLNDITILARDKNGNEVEVSREFFVDSKKPKIKKTYPKKKSFADGLFEVVFDEMNPALLVLYYGFDGEGEKVLNIEEDCEIIKKKYYCDTQVDLSPYNGRNIKYWFELRDIVGTQVSSKKVDISVDTTAPVLINSESFWSQGVGRYEKYVYFDMEIDEENFDEVSYFYEDSRGKMREKRLCSRLKEGKCVARKSFKRGNTLLNIQIIDEAGNIFIKEIGLDVEY